MYCFSLALLFACPWPLRGTFCRSWAALGHFWAAPGRSWAALRLLLAALGPLLAALGLLLAALGLLLATLGPILVALRWGVQGGGTVRRCPARELFFRGWEILR